MVPGELDFMPQPHQRPRIFNQTLGVRPKADEVEWAQRDRKIQRAVDLNRGPLDSLRDLPSVPLKAHRRIKKSAQAGMPVPLSYM